MSAVDPCRQLREELAPRFTRALSRPGIYLANHSLGRPLDRTADDLSRFADLWYAEMDDAWEAWMATLTTFCGHGGALLGQSGEWTIPKTSAGQALRSVISALPRSGEVRPINIVTTHGEFDSVDFILRAYHAKGRANVTWVDEDGVDGPVSYTTAEAVIDALTPETDLVVVSQVAFQTGRVFKDLERLHAVCQDRGVYLLVDTYHGFGVLPSTNLAFDFAIGGSYKYVRGGPGACWLTVREGLAERDGLQTLDTGWFAKADTFGYGRHEEPAWAEGGRGWWESTPAVVTAYQALAGLELLGEIGIDRLREVSLLQQGAMRDLFRLAGVPVFEPDDPAHYGAFSLVFADDPAGLVSALKQQGISVDARGGSVRFGPDALNTVDEFERVARVLYHFFS